MNLPRAELQKIRNEASQLYLLAANRYPGKGELGFIYKLREKVIASSRDEFRKPNAKANLDFHLFRSERLLKQSLITIMESNGDAAVDALIQMHEVAKSLEMFGAERPDLAFPVERMRVSKTDAEPLIHFALRHKVALSTIHAINDFQSYFLPSSSELMLKGDSHSGWFENHYTMHYRVFISGSNLLDIPVIGNGLLGELSIRVAKEPSADANPVPTTTRISLTKDGYAYCTGVAVYFSICYSQTRFADSGQPPLKSLKAIVSDHGKNLDEFSSQLAARGAIGLEKQENYKFSLRHPGSTPQVEISANIRFSTPAQVELKQEMKEAFKTRFGDEGFASIEPIGPDGASSLTLVFSAGKLGQQITDFQKRLT